MKADRLPEDDPSETGDFGGAPAQASGATSIFATLSTGQPDLARPVAQPADDRVKSAPVVHSVVFKANAPATEQTDQLLNLLRTGDRKAAPFNPGADVMPLDASQPLAPVTPPLAATPALRPQVPDVTGSSGGFTQLLRALNYDQGKADARKTSMPEVASSDVTQVSRLAPAAGGDAPGNIGESPERAAAAPAPQASSSSAKTQSESAEPMRASSAPVTSTAAVSAVSQPQATKPPASSFTQLFRSLDASLAQSASAPPAPTAMSAVPSASAAPSAPPAPFAIADESPAARTRQSEAAETILPATGPSAVVLSPTASAAHGASNHAEPSIPAAPPADQGQGSFTQIYQTLGRTDLPAQPQEDKQPGSFTQLFQSTAGASEKRSEEHILQSSEPGSFTQMFRSLDASPPPVVHPEAKPDHAPGSFTQMFAALQGNAPPAEPPFSVAAPSEPVAMPGAPAGIFAGSQTSAPHSALSSRTSSAPSSAGSAPQGGLTQLLRALEQPVPGAPPNPQPGVSQPLPSSSPATFTSVYGKLDSSSLASGGPSPLIETPPSAPPPGPVPHLGEPADTAPSEFTRIVSASAAREGAMRAGAMVPPVPTVPTSSAAASPAWSMPTVPGALPLPAAPTLPPIPQPTIPVAVPTPPSGAMQKFLPLVLILVILLLVAVLIAVVLLMKK